MRDAVEIAFRQKMEKTLRCGSYHFGNAARRISDVKSQYHQADDDDDGLNKISNGNRPHAADVGVKNHHRRAADDAPVKRNARERREYHRHSHQLSGYPTKIRGYNKNGRYQFGSAAVSDAEEVHKREDVHFVKLAGKKSAHQNEAQSRAERVFHNAQHALVHKTRGRSHDGFRTKPSGKQRRAGHHQWQAPARHHKVAGIFHPPGSPPAYGDGEQQVQCDGD